MENLFAEVIKFSPIIGIIIIFWFYQRKDYKELVDRVQTENATREKSYQEVISNLTKNFNIVEDVKKDVEDIKIQLFK